MNSQLSPARRSNRTSDQYQRAIEEVWRKQPTRTPQWCPLPPQKEDLSRSAYYEPLVEPDVKPHVKPHNGMGSTMAVSQSLPSLRRRLHSDSELPIFELPPSELPPLPYASLQSPSKRGSPKKLPQLALSFSETVREVFQYSPSRSRTHVKSMADTPCRYRARVRNTTWNAIGNETATSTHQATPHHASSTKPKGRGVYSIRKAGDDVAFTQLDIDSSGMIDVGELVAYYTSQGVSRDQSE
jgi:hypothetical protein